jgi:hypothetical protein
VCIERAEKERRVTAESRMEAERNLMAFLCHEIRNPVGRECRDSSRRDYGVLLF